MHYLQWMKYIYPRKTLSNQLQCQCLQCQQQAELQDEIQSSELNMVQHGVWNFELLISPKTDCNACKYRTPFAYPLKQSKKTCWYKIKFFKKSVLGSTLDWVLHSQLQQKQCWKLYKNNIDQETSSAQLLKTMLKTVRCTALVLTFLIVFS